LRSTTVQINIYGQGSDSPGGSGVIIDKRGDTYTVLTANHVVCEVTQFYTKKFDCAKDLRYTVGTYTGQEYPINIKTRRIFQKNVKKDPDLATVTFQAKENYPVAELGNSDDLQIGTDIIVTGFPSIFGKKGIDRNYTATPGKLVSRNPGAESGYSLIYNANTFIGNSGGPVFDNNGRVIAIHGIADATAIEGNSISSRQKTGFNAGIPINTFLSLQLGADGEPLICNLKPNNSEFYQESQLQTLANQITVKVIANNNSGSGTIVGKSQDRYLLLTNSHVLSAVDIRQLKIRTHDGMAYPAKALNIFNHLDLAVLEFTSNRPYCVPKKISYRNTVKGASILAAGYPNLRDKVTFKGGEVQQNISDPSFKDGYEIGYTSDIEQGMSGGAILNYRGHLIGINGRSSYPISNWYIYANGDRPTDGEIEQFRRLSWGIPMRVFVSNADPNVLADYNLSLLLGN
ncbi:S1 family peptidase, partial [Cylindrospermopsis raciborskii]|uniref:S1 family peptidase n=1 Tax=Cylindrospermopsis raciborskii TaxID=77022 RepID=UPI00128F51D5